MSPKVSIIVPVYNVEKYIHRCVESLINQTLKDIEIILVDDESPDSCPSICDEYAQKDARIKVIHKKNEGLGLTRNAGLEIASGEFIAFIDSDDWVDLTMYETLYNTAKNNQCDTVYCSLQYYYSPNKIIPFKEVNEETFFQVRKEIDTFLLDMLAPLPTYHSDVKYMVSVCKAIYSRNIIRNHHLKFVSERIIASEDMVFHTQYLKLSEKIGFIPKYFYNYFQNENSITHTYTETKIERLKKFIQEMDVTFSQYFNQSEYYIRLQRKALHYLRTSLYIKYQITKSHPFIEQIKEFKELCDDEIFSKTLVDYPYHLLPLKHRLFYFFIKFKITSLLILMYKLHKV